MSKYTTEVRYICESSLGMQQGGGANEVDSIIASAIPKIFNFDFPIFDESYRTVLETKILKHYYTREIAHETVGLWKLKLQTKLNEIMPYYNKLYESELLEINPLYTHNLTRTHNTKFDSDRTTGNETSGTSTEFDAYSDTPQGTLNNVKNDTYLTNARKLEDSSTSSSSGDDKYNSTEDYIEHVTGYEGKDVSELLLKWRKTFLNIDLQIIEELEPLFFQLW